MIVVSSLVKKNKNNLVISGNFSEANFEGSILNNIVLRDLTMYYCLLNNCDLQNTNFSNSNLTGSSFLNSNLTNIILNNARLRFVNLTNAIGLNENINIALNSINKNPFEDNEIWELTWIDGSIYECNPITGLFVIKV